MAVTGDTILHKVREVAEGFAAERKNRQQRRSLAAADFARLADAGYRLTAVPVDQAGRFPARPRSATGTRTCERSDSSGLRGAWRSTLSSTRPVRRRHRLVERADG